MAEKGIGTGTERDVSSLTVTEDDTYHDWGLVIDGEFVDSESGERYDVENPADKSVVGSAPDGSTADVGRAIESARECYEEVWRHTEARDRGELLHQIADAIEDNFETLVKIETLENGKNLEWSRNDVEHTVTVYRYYAGAADKNHGDTLPQQYGFHEYTLREPYGVIGSVIPWNWPTVHTADFTVPQLATGNTVVLKPAPFTPLSSLKMAEIWADILPAGAVNIVTGGVEPGVRLTQHPDIDKLAFTGHSKTGTKVMKAAAENITDVMLELGGKNAQLVLPDADLERTLEGIFGGIFYNQGQACTAGSRLVVHEDVEDELVGAIVDRVSGYTIGPGTDLSYDLGPVISGEHQEKIEKYIDIGKEEGATVVYEGEVPSDFDGYYVPPVVFGDVSPDMQIAQEEIFGPVLAVISFTSIKEAVDIVNGTEYGLTTGIWTQNPEVANRLARRVESGLVCVNNYFRGGLGNPFGGYKKSGIGRKMGFEDTLREFTQVKTVRNAMVESDADLDDFYQ